MSRGTEVDGLKILLVDDDEDCREFLMTALEGNGVHVTDVEDAENGVEALKGGEFDAIVTDKNLPGMDGISFIRHIREHYGDVPVILITGQSSVGSAIEAFKLGAQDYLVKPLQGEEDLLHALWKAVKNHRMAKENATLQDELIRAKRMEALGVLSGGVAHDLNNILCPLVVLPRILMRQIEKICAPGVGGMEQIKDELGQIESLNRRAADVVQDLLTFSEVGSYEKAQCNLNEIVKNYVDGQDFAELKGQAKNVEVAVNLADRLPLIDGSPPHLIRVLNNIVRNSCEAMELAAKKGGRAQGHRLEIATDAFKMAQKTALREIVEAGDYARLRVIDTGTGIEPQHVDRIFEPFFSTKDMSSTTGSGIGLSIAHRVLRDHSAPVNVITEVGKGTTFEIYFPASHGS